MPCNRVSSFLCCHLFLITWPLLNPVNFCKASNPGSEPLAAQKVLPVRGRDGDRGQSDAVALTKMTYLNPLRFLFSEPCVSAEILILPFQIRDQKWEFSIFPGQTGCYLFGFPSFCLPGAKNTSLRVYGGRWVVLLPRQVSLAAGWIRPSSKSGAIH